MADKQKFYITTAISYPNGAPHIGHAYEVVASDAIARFKRIDGYDVFFVTGTDEHGLKIQQTADKSGTTPKAFVDEMATKFKAMADRLDCSYDRFIRTTDADHLPSTQELWRRMQEKGDIYLSKYSGWYSVRDEAYYDESELTKQPDGSWRAPTGTPVEWIEEESYFFRLAAYQDRLLAHYEANPDFISPETRRNEITSFVRSGLQDLSISRTTFNWGLPVPGAPKHVMYVWIDALNNYVTGCGFPDENDPRWHYWPADVHIIGKDIVRFHTVYWPAFLMSAELPLPKRVFGHGFLLNKGEKMSKSVGNVVDPFDLADTYGVDQIRYGRNDRATARDFVTNEFRRDNRGNTRAPGIPWMLLCQPCRTVAVLRCLLLRNFPRLVFADGDVLHFRGDDAFAGVVHLRDILAYHRPSRLAQVSKPQVIQLRISRALASILGRDVWQFF